MSNHPPPRSKSSESDDRTNMRSSTAPPDPASSHVSRSLPAPPMPPHSYRHHPHAPPTHPHQQMIFMPLPPHPGSRRDAMGPIPRPQQHLNTRTNAPPHPATHHQPHLYYSNHRPAPLHHPFMMTLPMQQHHQTPHGHGIRRTPHQMQPPPPPTTNASASSAGKVSSKSGKNVKSNSSQNSSSTKTRQPYMKKSSGVKWTSEEVRFS